MPRAQLVLAFALLVPACSDPPASSSTQSAPAGPKYEPMVSKELVPPVLKGLVVGTASDADLSVAFGQGKLAKDKSFGGASKVEYSDAPAVRVTLPAKDDVVDGQAWLVPDTAGKLVLQRIEITTKTSGTCAWVESHIAGLPGAKNRPLSNRVYGKEGRGWALTAGTPDGSQAVGIDCGPGTRDGVAVETVSYTIEPGGGVSMMVLGPDA